MKIEINQDDQKKLMNAWTFMQDHRAGLGQFVIALQEELAKLDQHKGRLEEKKGKIIAQTQQACQKFQAIFESIRDNSVPAGERDKYQYLPDMGAFVHQAEIEKLNEAASAKAALSKVPTDEAPVKKE
jgi:ABC-type Zn uptake system ZnuABC Zn-binding protein ZnuA